MSGGIGGFSPHFQEGFSKVQEELSGLQKELTGFVREGWTGSQISQSELNSWQGESQTVVENLQKLADECLQETFEAEHKGYATYKKLKEAELTLLSDLSQMKHALQDPVISIPKAKKQSEGLKKAQKSFENVIKDITKVTAGMKEIEKEEMQRMKDASKTDALTKKDIKGLQEMKKKQEDDEMRDIREWVRQDRP